MKVQIVLGAFFGDEGKGSTVQWLCQRALSKGERPLVVRFSGGPQAGHRVVMHGGVGSLEHVCSSFGSGVLLGVPTWLAPQVLVDPISLKLEYDELQRKGIAMPPLFISPECRIITPYDVWANLNSSTILGHGSCGKGIFTTMHRYSATEANSVGANASERLNIHLRIGANASERLNAGEQLLRQASAYYKAQYADTFEPLGQYEQMFLEAWQWLHDNSTFSNPTEMSADNYDTIIFEGSQGLLLDMDHGFMPWCTPSSTGLKNLAAYLSPEAEVYLVMRSYLTRHGNGYEPQGEDILKKEYTNLDEPTNLDDGTQGRFKRGLFDTGLLQRAVDRHCLDNLQQSTSFKCYIAITHLDCCPSDCFSVLSGGIVSRTTLPQLTDTLCHSSGLSINGIYGSASEKLYDKQFKLL